MYFFQAKSAVEAGIAREGSNLCGMAAFITWDERKLESVGMDAIDDNMNQVIIKYTISPSVDHKVKYVKGLN